MRVTVLAGGVGSARFCAGLAQVVDPSELTIVVNTGDDERVRGLYVCPDIDTVLYHLSGLCDWDRGWGVHDESYAVQERYLELAAAAGVEAQEWFTLGDRDLALNLLRTALLQDGRGLAEATDAVRRALAVECRVLPVTEDKLRTVIHARDGRTLDFQEYFVKLRQKPEVSGVSVTGAAEARPAPGVIEALADSDVVVIPPSNPILSIDPPLAVPGVREALAGRTSGRIGVSPIVGGRALKGPADLLMRFLGHDVSAAGVAAIYAGLLDAFVIDDGDAALAPRVEQAGMRAVVCDTIMRSASDAARLAKLVLENAG